MARPIYSAIGSVDGYVEDAEGRFDWAKPDEEVFRSVNDPERPIGTYLNGRRMYETMLSWETASLGDQPDFIRDFTHIWRGADKIVYSRSLVSAPSARTRIERSFDPEAVPRLKAAARDDFTIGGADLAGQAIRAGLVDELQLFAVPVVVGATLNSRTHVASRTESSTPITVSRAEAEFGTGQVNHAVLDAPTASSV